MSQSAVPPAAPTISIVIPAYNEAHELPNLLASLAPLTADARFEVIVVDNGSTDDTAKVAGTMGARATTIVRVPVGQARNLGASLARGVILAFLDADVVVTDEWLRSMAEIADGTRRFDGITGDIYDVAKPGTWIERSWFELHYRKGVLSYINGGNIVITAADFARVAGFDASMISGEDFDFCERARRIGLSIQGDRALRVIHHGYPKGAKGFVKREIWHGAGDFESMAAVAKSSTAVATILFIALHVLLIAALLTAHWHASTTLLAGIVLYCVAMAIYKWRGAPPLRRVLTTPVMYLYFFGRSIAALKAATGYGRVSRKRVAS